MTYLYAYAFGNFWGKLGGGMYNTTKPVCNDLLYNKIYYLWFIQWCVSVMTEGTISLVLTISAFWSSSRWPLALDHLDELQKAEKYPIMWSL